MTTPENPDLEYNLAPDIRAAIRPIFDANAVERLLQRVPAESRDYLLQEFIEKTPAKAQPDNRLPDVSILTRISHPVLQDILEDIWQPYWSRFSDERLERSDSDIPGRLRALKRRRGAA
jgi:hypothetical protein